MHGRRLSMLLPALLAAGAARAAPVRDAGDVCSPAANPCVVNRRLEVAHGVTLDFGGRGLEVAGRGRVDIGPGSVSIIAGSLKLDSAATIVGNGTLILSTTGTILIDPDARIDLSAAEPGRVLLNAGGEVRINGGVNANANGALDGGYIEIRAASIAVGRGGGLRAAGGTQGVGGLVVLITGGGVQLDGPVAASGAESGGSIEITAAAVATTAALDVGAGAGGAGGSVDIAATGAVSLGGPIVGEGTGTVAAGGGVGAEVSVVARGPIDVSAPITAAGGSPGGQGGTVDISTDLDLTVRAPIVVVGRGNDGDGGDVSLAAGGILSMGDVDVHGGGGGGSLTAATEGVARITGVLMADGALTQGQGGLIEVRACDLDMDTAARLSAQGVGGRNTLRASGQMVLRGAVVGGDNVLQYRDPAFPPIVLGSLTPPTAPVINGELRPCGEVRGGPSTTTTTTLPAPPAGECVGGGLAGFDAALCRLSAIKLALAGAPPQSLGGKRTARRLKATITKVLRLVEKSRKRRRATKKLGAAERQLASFTRQVERGLARGKIDPVLGARLLGLAGDTSPLLAELRTASV